MARPKQISDVQLLESARRIFLKHGPNVPVSLIARQLGVTVGALFYRIPSKDQLLLAALDPGVPPGLAFLRNGFQPDIPASHQLIEILTSMASYLNTSIACWYSLRTAGLLQSKEKQFMSYPTKLRTAMTAWIKSAQQHGGIRPGNPKILAELLLATTEMRFTMAYLTHRKHSAASDRAFVEELVREILQPGQA